MSAFSIKINKNLNTKFKAYCKSILSASKSYLQIIIEFCCSCSKLKYKLPIEYTKKHGNRYPPKNEYLIKCYAVKHANNIEYLILFYNAIIKITKN